MANYSTNEFKGGLKIMLDGEPCNILENEYVKPGKGQAFNRVKIRKLISGKVLEKTFLAAQITLLRFKALVQCKFTGGNLRIF